MVAPVYHSVGKKASGRRIIFAAPDCRRVSGMQIVGLSMISYTETQKIKESSFRREPVKWTHRKVIVIAKMNSKLCFEVLK